MELVTLVYEATQHFPRDEQFGLTSQLRRAAISIPSNIAEGAARNSKKEFIHFVGIARGSIAELETQLLIAVNLGYLPDATSLLAHTDTVSRLLTGLHKYLSRAAIQAT